MKKFVYVFILILVLVAALFAGDQYGRKVIWDSGTTITVDVDSGGAYSRTNVPLLNHLICTIPTKDFGKMWARFVCTSAPTFTGDTVAIYFKTPDGTILATDSVFAAATKTFYVKVDTTTTRYIPEIIVSMNIYLDSTFSADASYDYGFTFEYLWKP